MGPEIADALKSAAAGVLIDVEVVPGASSSVFPAGFNPWRKRIEARVAAPPEKGEANAELASLVARYFGVPGRDVEVTAGHTTRRKTLLVRGVTAAGALAKLAEATR